MTYGCPDNCRCHYEPVGERRASDARLTDSESGKAIGSAEKESSAVPAPPVRSRPPTDPAGQA